MTEEKKPLEQKKPIMKSRNLMLQLGIIVVVFAVLFTLNYFHVKIHDGGIFG